MGFSIPPLKTFHFFTRWFEDVRKFRTTTLPVPEGLDDIIFENPHYRVVYLVTS